MNWGFDFRNSGFNSYVLIRSHLLFHILSPVSRCVTHRVVPSRNRWHNAEHISVARHRSPSLYLILSVLNAATANSTHKM